MRLLLLAGIITIVGSIVFLVTPMFTAPGLYEMTAEQRVEFVLANRVPFRIQNTLLAFSGLLTAVGYLMWTLQFRDQAAPWLHYLAASSFLLGAVLLAVFFYQMYQNPGSYYLAEKMSWQGVAYFVLTGVAVVLYGFLFLQTDFPNWLGYLSLVVAVGMLAGLLFIGGKDLPPQPFYVTTLISGIIFLLR